MQLLRKWLVSVILDALKERDLQMDAALEELKGARGQDAANTYDRISHGRLY